MCGWRVGGGGGGTGVEEKGWLFYSDTGLTAAWQWRPRHCLLGTKPVTQDKSTNQDWSWFLPEEWGVAVLQPLELERRVGYRAVAQQERLTSFTCRSWRRGS